MWIKVDLGRGQGGVKAGVELWAWLVFLDSLTNPTLSLIPIWMDFRWDQDRKNFPDFIHTDGSLLDIKCTTQTVQAAFCHSLIKRLRIKLIVQLKRGGKCVLGSDIEKLPP